MIEFPDSFDKFVEDSTAERGQLYELGAAHKAAGLPPDYSKIKTTPSGKSLKYYKEAYDAGYNGVPRVPKEFTDVEAVLAKMPTKPL